MDIKKISRNPDTGLIEGIEYVFTPEGLVDWRKMIKPEFLAVNKQYFESRNVPVPESTEGLQDKELLILLGGIKNLARLRGFESVEFLPMSSHPDYVVCACRIGWTGNFETEFKHVAFSAVGDASPYNTNEMGRKYLGPIAENRAFVRCVRNFLNINIVGQDEIGPKAQEQEMVAATNTPTAVLEKLMVEKGVSFENLKIKLIAEKLEGASTFTSINDIPKIKLFDLIERLKNKKA